MQEQKYLMTVGEGGSILSLPLADLGKEYAYNVNPYVAPVPVEDFPDDSWEGAQVSEVRFADPKEAQAFFDWAALKSLERHGYDGPIPATHHQCCLVADGHLTDPYSKGFVAVYEDGSGGVAWLTRPSSSIPAIDKDGVFVIKVKKR